MPRRTIITIAAGGLFIALAALAYLLRPSAAPSGQLTAIPISATDTQPPQLTATLQQAPTDTPAQPPTPTSGPQVFALLQSESQARFTIEEILSGQPNTVVGVTNQLAAQLLIDSQNPAASQLGIVQVNARTFVTDNESRNRAIRNFILDVADYEFITFNPQELIGLPDSVAVGDSFTFEILGDLTIRHITREVTFSATVTVDSATRLHGLAAATIQRGDYELTIPQVPRVAGVEESVLLELDFVAVVE